MREKNSFEGAGLDGEKLGGRAVDMDPELRLGNLVPGREIRGFQLKIDGIT